MPFTFQPLAIPDIILVESKVFTDLRGGFFETFKSSEFKKAGLPDQFPQDNLSWSKKDVLRGLHYQKTPKAQGKLVSVLKGRAWDVAVDIRPDSATYLKWIGIELDDAKQAMLYIPTGFAHGFLALTDEVCFFYKCTEEYDQASEAGIRWNDPDIAINWPVISPILSEKDRMLPYVNQGSTK
jgi:dTDP-4-dehydrorhamnose 3,5-epimerase